MSQRKLYNPQTKIHKEKQRNIIETVIANAERVPEYSRYTVEFRNTYQAISSLESQLKGSQSLNTSYRLNLMSKYDELISLDLNAAFKLDIFERKWKLLVYFPIQKNRPKFAAFQSEERQEWKEYLSFITENYAEFLRNSKNIKSSLVAKTLISMGDICRYQTLYFAAALEKTGLLSSAEEYYMASLVVFPRNGHVQSLLGLLCLEKGQLLEAAAYYFMAMMNKKPFSSAQDNLMELFHISMANDSSDGVGLVSKVILDIVSSLFTKIDLDKTESKLLEFRCELERYIACVDTIDTQRRYKWWFSFGLVSISICKYVVSSDFHVGTVEAMLIHWGSMISIAFHLMAGDGRYSEAFSVFVYVLLTWICENKLWKYLKLPPEWKEISIMTTDFTSVWNNGISLPEECLFETVEILSHCCSKSPLTMEILKFEFDSAMRDERRDRCSKLIGYLSLTSADIFTASRSTDQIPKPPRVQEYDFRTSIPAELSQHHHYPSVVELDLKDLDERSDDDFGSLITGISQFLTIRTDLKIQLELQSLKHKKEALLTSVEFPPKIVECLLFDTNCWLKNYSLVREIILSTTYKVIVPLAGWSY